MVLCIVNRFCLIYLNNRIIFCWILWSLHKNKKLYLLLYDLALNTFKLLIRKCFVIIPKTFLLCSRFHGVYWPAFLIAAGLEPPACLSVNSHWTVDNEKMSKTLGNVVAPSDAAQNFTAAGLRYFLLREGTLHSDASKALYLNLVYCACNGLFGFKGI